MLISFPALANSEQGPKTEWTQYINNDGIIGYEHSVPRSKYLESRAETIINAPIEVLLEVLKDIPSYPQWMHNCLEAILIKQDEELNRVLYIAQDTPFGWPDRDVIIESFTVDNLDNGSYTITLRSIANHPFKHPQNETSKKRQRMLEFSGSWTFQMIERERTRVSYTVHTNPGGFAPRFIVNSEIRKVSFMTLRGMIAKAKEDAYIAAAAKSEIRKKIETAIKNGKLAFTATPQIPETHFRQ
ncbi:MAG: START domain-containing protein [Candidatus Thiodiazotropha sp.]|jgi:uncharacterized membrane protein